MLGSNFNKTPLVTHIITWSQQLFANTVNSPSSSTRIVAMNIL